MQHTWLLAIAACCTVPLAAAQELPCIAARDSMRSAFPGYDNDLGAKQPASHKLLLQCLTQSRVCLLLDGGKVLKAQAPSEVHIGSRKVLFGLVQTHRGASRSYCTIGSLVANEGGPFWIYDTYAPNGDGAIAEGIQDTSDSPKTSAELFDMLEKNFRHSMKELRRSIAAKEINPKELGYRDGEKP